MHNSIEAGLSNDFPIIPLRTYVFVISVNSVEYFLGSIIVKANHVLNSMKNDPDKTTYSE